VNNRNSDPPDSEPADGLLELSLEDTLAQKMRGIPVKSRTAVAGYNPYDAVPAGKPKDKDKDKHSEKDKNRKPTDLRKLSEWIRMQRQVADLKKQES
jgi:hypothetical protein